MVFTSCGKWLTIYSPVDSQMKTSYIPIEFIAAFHVNTLQQLHLPVNSFICKHEGIPSKTFQPI